MDIVTYILLKKSIKGTVEQDVKEEVQEEIGKIIQDLSSETSFTISAADWTTLTTTGVLDIPGEIHGLDPEAEFANIKASINGSDVYIKLEKTGDIYNSAFILQDGTYRYHVMLTAGNSVTLNVIKLGTAVEIATYLESIGGELLQDVNNKYLTVDE